MKTTVDPKLCIGCGLCSELAPEIFEMKEGKVGMISVVKRKIELSERDFLKKATEAALACPVTAIKVA